jgi:hypothetical protein
MLSAIVDPLLYLLNQVAAKPIDTLVQLLPNVA